MSSPTTSRPSTPTTRSSTTPPPSSTTSSSPEPTIEILGNFGPNKEKVPTVLVEHRILVVILYSAIVFCLVLGIIVSFCLLMRCRKNQELNEVSSDTASSDLPIIKADAKRYTASIGKKHALKKYD